MNILHTSDWHLGRSLYGRKRYGEYTDFLNWMVHTIEEEKVDILLVAGDVFDTTTPSNRSQELYYRFLCRVASSCCRHVVIIGGNHDSPSFLNAPKELLRTLNVHVIGSMNDALENEVIAVVGGEDLEESAIICAVPYLRDKDVRTVEPGETIDDKNRKLDAGIKAHYAEVVDIAERKREEMVGKSADKESLVMIPIIGMGHLFTSGGTTVDGDGVRELYVGSLAHIGLDAFPAAIDYMALGHLHTPQVVGGVEHVRYSGSPLPMSFGEARQKKKVVLITFANTLPHIKEITVPCFQKLVRVVGDLDAIYAKLEELKDKECTAWLEIEYTGSDMPGNLHEMLDEIVTGSGMEILRITNRCVMERVMQTIGEDESLDDLDIEDVFLRCLDAFEIPGEEREELMISYREIMRDLLERDCNE